MRIGWFPGLGTTGFGGAPLDGSAFSARPVGRLPAFRADDGGAPFGGDTLSRRISHAGLSDGDGKGEGENDED